MKSSQIVSSLVTCFAVASLISFAKGDDEKGSDPLGLMTKTRIKRLGYQAKEFILEVEPGYNISMVRIINPKLRSIRGFPLILMHGAGANGASFMIMSNGTEARDYSHLKPDQMSRSQMENLLKNDENSYSLPLLLSSFGYDVWFMNRRSTVESLLLSGQPELYSFITNGALTLNEYSAPIKPLIELANGPLLEGLLKHLEPIQDNLAAAIYELFVKLYKPDIGSMIESSYWTFSVTRQIRIDVPKAVDFVLSETGSSQVILGGHSSGGAYPLVAMADSAQLNDKVRGVLSIAPTNKLGGRKKIEIFSDILKKFDGPLPNIATTALLKYVPAFFTRFEANKGVFTQLMVDIYDSGMRYSKIQPDLFYMLGKVESSKEKLENWDFVGNGRVVAHDYQDASLNQAAYGQTTGPTYDFHNIKNASILIFLDNVDTNIASEQYFKSDFSIPVDVEYVIPTEGAETFGHINYLVDERSRDLVFIPAVQFVGKLNQLKPMTLPCISNDLEHSCADWSHQAAWASESSH